MPRLHLLQGMQLRNAPVKEAMLSINPTLIYIKDRGIAERAPANDTMQKLSPDGYAALALPDQWIEDVMQEQEARWLVDQTTYSPRVLDLGFGSGIVAKALQAAGRDVCVVEGAGHSCNEMAMTGIPFVKSLFENYTPHRDFDCVIASFVLEHVADPVELLRRCAQWAPKLLAVVGNAASWHRRLAVKMGMQPLLHTLSPRDHAVGHYRVYDMQTITRDLSLAGWKIVGVKGFMFKPLPNAMMTHFDERLLRAMCEIHIEPRDAANIGFVCERL